MNVKTIIPKQASDFDGAMIIQDRIFSPDPEYTAKGAYEKTKDSTDTQILIAEIDGNPAGYTIMYERSPGYIHIWQMGVLEEFRGRGIASAFYKYVEDYAKEKGFKGVTINTFNRFATNLRLAIKRGYKIYDLEKYHDKPNEPKIKLKLEFNK
jgi:GNAT superfamily N-acetyltransferase